MPGRIPIEECHQFIENLEKDEIVILGFDGFSRQGDKWVQPIDRIATFTSPSLGIVPESERYEISKQIIAEWQKGGFYQVTHIEFVLERYKRNQKRDFFKKV